jgi:HlyD family secretion protein
LEARKAELLKLKNGSRPEEIEQARATTLAARVAFIKAEKEFQRAQNLLPSGAVSKEVFDNAKAARDQAEAQLKAAEATQRLVERGPRQEDIARARAMVEEAWARLAEAQRRLEDTQLRSPTAGVIQTKVREVGDFVGIGEPVYVLSITNPVWVRAYVNEVDLGKIRPGMKAMVRTDAGQSFEGQVGFISPVAEFTPKTVETKEIRTDLVYRIRVIVQDPKNELRQGMPVSVFIDLEQQDK